MNEVVEADEIAMNGAWVYRWWRMPGGEYGYVVWSSIALEVAVENTGFVTADVLTSQHHQWTVIEQYVIVQILINNYGGYRQLNATRKPAKDTRRNSTSGQGDNIKGKRLCRECSVRPTYLSVCSFENSTKISLSPPQYLRTPSKRWANEGKVQGLWVTRYR